MLHQRGHRLLDDVLHVDDVRHPDRRRDGDPPHALPRLRVGQLGEDPLVRGVADGVEDRAAQHPVVGAVPEGGREAGRRPRVPEVHGHHQLGPVPPDRRGDGPPQVQPLHQSAVGVAEELDHRHPHRGRGPSLLPLAHRAGGLRRQPGDAGLATGGQHVPDVAPGGGPGGDGGRGPVLDVVGVGDDDQGALPVVGEGLVRALGLRGHGSRVCLRRSAGGDPQQHLGQPARRADHRVVPGGELHDLPPGL